eukprot:COSAG01_NODE_7454_length_3204_cov_15.414681_1_plen_279_part_00
MGRSTLAKWRARLPNGGVLGPPQDRGRPVVCGRCQKPGCKACARAAARERERERASQRPLLARVGQRSVRVAQRRDAHDAEDMGEDMASPRQVAGAPPTAMPVKVERDGGWPGEFQELRQRPFDAAEYEQLIQFFLAPGGRAVPRGGRVTRSRQDEMARLAEWPRLNQVVRAMHASGQREEALRHLRCVEEYMRRVNHPTLPRIMRGEGEMAGFVDGEEVDLVGDSDEEGDDLNAIDVEALESMLIGGADSVGAVAANSSVAGQMDVAIKRIKREMTR